MVYRVEFDREEDGRWIADVPEIPGVLAYGSTQEDARRGVEALALHVLADQIANGQVTLKDDDSISFRAA